MKRSIWLPLILVTCLFLVKSVTNNNSQKYDSKFQQQIEDYVSNCSLQYYKIRSYGELYTTSVYEYRTKEIWDSLRSIYPDSMKYLVNVEGEDQSPRFYTGENVIAKLSKRLDDRIKTIEIEVEYEVDIGCCDEKICCSYFIFDPDSQLIKVKESDFYLTMPRHSKDFIMAK